MGMDINHSLPMLNTSDSARGGQNGVKNRLGCEKRIDLKPIGNHAFLTDIPVCKAVEVVLVVGIHGLKILTRGCLKDVPKDVPT